MKEDFHSAGRIKKRYDHNWGADEAREIWAMIRTNKHRFICNAGHGCNLVEVKINNRPVYAIYNTSEQSLVTVLTKQMMKEYIKTGRKARRTRRV